MYYEIKFTVFLPSSALAKLSLIITENKLTPHPAHPGKLSEWAQTNCEDNFTTDMEKFSNEEGIMI